MSKISRLNFSKFPARRLPLKMLNHRFPKIPQAQGLTVVAKQMREEHQLRDCKFWNRSQIGTGRTQEMTPSWPSQCSRSEWKVTLNQRFLWRGSLTLKNLIKDLYRKWKFKTQVGFIPPKTSKSGMPHSPRKTRMILGWLKLSNGSCSWPGPRSLCTQKII